MIGRYWNAVRDGDSRAVALYLRHYSARHYRDGRPRSLFVGPGEKLVLLTTTGQALWAWRRSSLQPDRGGQRGVGCAVFRREGGPRASDLIAEAMEWGRAKWPGESRFFTFVNPKTVESPNPGYCFKVVGWRVSGLTKGGLVTLEWKP